MARSPCCEKQRTKKGAWSAEEDEFLPITSRFMAKASLQRCAKSCSNRWLNYLRPGIKRGNFTKEEEDLIVRLHRLLGNRLPERTDKEIKNYWNTAQAKKCRTFLPRSRKRRSNPEEEISNYQIGGSMNNPNQVNANEPSEAGMSQEENHCLADKSIGLISNSCSIENQGLFSPLPVEDGGDEDYMSFLMNTSIDEDFMMGVLDSTSQLFPGDRTVHEDNNYDISSGFGNSNVMSSSRSDITSDAQVVKVQTEVMGDQQPSLHAELKKLASVLDLGDE
ncbi:hypothetical protein BT93_J1947 [Corymbia citriodora subsp. variegata]|nr:hypothetical protein BT93_J1947 [Corymbia citriodora subsp. variegata]